jgi:hypothetical protein
MSSNRLIHKDDTLHTNQREDDKEEIYKTILERGTKIA